MKLRDVLTKPTTVFWRMLIANESILAGKCEWDGEKLISLDGDTYNLDEEIVGFLQRDDYLTYWTKE